jgi:hypothetical protein
MTISELIEREGGSTAFSRKTGIPLRTSEDWKWGKRKPPKWLLPLLVLALEKMADETD